MGRDDDRLLRPHAGRRRPDQAPGAHAPEAYEPKPLPTLDADLARLAHAALGSQPAFDAFAKAVHEKLPQVDRVCVTSVQDGNYVVQRSAYPGKKITHFAETGFQAAVADGAADAFCSVQSFRFFAGLECPGFGTSDENDHVGDQIERPCAGRGGRPAEQRQFLELRAESVS